MIAIPCDSEGRNQSRLAEQRNLLRSDLQRGDQDFAEGVAIEEGGERSQAVGKLRRTFVTRGGKSVDIARLVGKGGELQAEIGTAKIVGGGVAEQGAVLQRAGAELQRERVCAAREIAFADFEDAARAGFKSAA